MTYPTIPKLDLPFRLSTDGTFAAVEQDTPQDILNCAQAIIASPLGFHEWEPGLGITPLEFQQAGPDPGILMAEVERWEPRASLLADTDYQQLAEGQATVRISHDA